MTLESLVGNYRELRRREIKRVTRDDLFVRGKDVNPVELISLYYETLGLKDQRSRTTAAIALQKYIDLVEEGFGEILAYWQRHDNRLAYVSLLLYGKSEANLVVNLVGSSFRSSGLPAFAIHQSILAAKRRGLDIFDFNGANSPNRGDDKHSYGAGAVLYFDISLNREALHEY
jgi:hypothetical protein